MITRALLSISSLSFLLLLLSCSNPFSVESPDAADITDVSTDVSMDMSHQSASLDQVPLLIDNDDYFLLGGDIIINKNDSAHQQLISALNADNEVRLAKTTAMQYVIVPVWPKGVVSYTLTGFSSSEKSVIQNAMKSISNVCKVTFKQVSKNAAYVYKISKINNPSIGGQSTIGYTSNSYCQLTSVTWGICVHEFMHGLGFGHEHQRFDRDKYVTINTFNITSAYLSQFQKIPLETAYSVTTITNGKKTVTTKMVPYSKLVTAYDYGSIMHYPANAFAKKAILITINAKGHAIGQTKSISTNDQKALIAIYGKK